MRQRIGALAGPGAVAITVAGVGLAVATVLVKLTTPAQAASHRDAGFAGVLVPLLAMAAVGLVLSIRQPANPVGWLVSVSLIAFDLLLFGSAYSDRLTAAHDLPGWPIVPLAVLATLGWSAGFPLLLILLWDRAAALTGTRLIPSPRQVAVMMYDFSFGGVYDDAFSGTILIHLWKSMQRVYGGFFLAALLAIPLGLMIGRVKFLMNGKPCSSVRANA